MGCLLLLLVLVTTVLVSAGCSKPAGVRSALDDLQQAFPGAAATRTNVAATSAAQAAPTDANPYVSVALAAARNHDYAGGVLALETAKRVSNLTPQQWQAAQTAQQALTADLVTRAANGDPQAKADLAAIERTRSQ